MTAKNSNNDDGFKKEILQKLAERIRTIRKKKGYDNYEKFANEHNINRSQYGRYEKEEDLRITSLARVCRAFGMTLSEFFSEGFDD
jgi:transcriptional regulator with XRE-family HTH domain